jgi:putative DNA primase/helicase
MTTAMDDDLPPGVRLVASDELASARGTAKPSSDGREAIANLLEQIERDPLAAWEPAALALVAPLRGVDDLTMQRVRMALKRARADVAGWERALNEHRRRASRGASNDGAPPTPLDVRERYTDAWNAARFAEDYRDRVRFVPERGWHAWTGTHWEFDAEAALRCAQEFARTLAAEADADDEFDATKRMRTAEQLCSRAKIMAIVDLARGRSLLRVHAEGFDRDEQVLNCANGMIDLRSGALRPHDPNALCSRAVSVAFEPDAKATAFEAFLERVQPDAEVRAFLQRWCGYCATGCTLEQCLVVHWGTGANGKSTFVEAINHVLGQYARIIPSDVLLARSGQEAHPTERAQLCGLRHALVSETAGGKGWNENAVKQLTGDTKMTARYMRQDFFEFTITHKLSVCTNNRPEVRENSHAFWRRVHLIPWAVQIPEHEKDPHLADKLRGEAEGILAWVIRGAIAWSDQGLAPPAAIRAATEGYRNESDRLGQFLEERTRVLDGARVAASVLYRAWSDWCEARGESSGSQTAFGERMSARSQFAKVKSDGRMVYRGLVLREPNERSSGRDDRDEHEAGVPETMGSDFGDETRDRDSREGCSGMTTDTRAPAGAGTRADEKSEASLAYADHRDNYPCPPCDVNERRESAANAAGTVAGRVAEEEVPLLDVELDDGWEEP